MQNGYEILDKTEIMLLTVCEQDLKFHGLKFSRHWTNHNLDELVNLQGVGLPDLKYWHGDIYGSSENSAMK